MTIDEWVQRGRHCEAAGRPVAAVTAYRVARRSNNQPQKSDRITTRWPSEETWEEH